ncbi:MAG: hypothetical protein ACRDAM_07200 [Casimicrobium sp.]
MKHIHHRLQTLVVRVASIAVASAALSLVAGCASPTVVQREKIGDEQLSCEQLRFEIGEAERYKREAEKEKGVTGTNVAAALFFWPAIAGTYMNANDAIRAAEDRRSRLVNIYNTKRCK